MGGAYRGMDSYWHEYGIFFFFFFGEILKMHFLI